MSDPEITMQDVVFGRMLTAAFGASSLCGVLQGLGFINPVQLAQIRDSLSLSIDGIPPGVISDGARQIAHQAASEFGETHVTPHLPVQPRPDPT